MTDEQALATPDIDDAEESAGEEEKDLHARLKESVGVDVEDVGPLRRKVTVTIPRAVLDDQAEEQYVDLSRNALIPGFRKGRAPRRLVEKRFGKEVGDQIKSQMLGGGYIAAIEKAELKTVSDPMIWIGPEAEGEKKSERLVTVDQALDVLDVPVEGDLVFACEVEIRPEFELPPLEKIPLTRPKIEVTDEDVTEHIDRMRGMRGSFEPVEGRIKADDLVVADVKMTVDGETVESQENMSLGARGQNLFGVDLPDLGKSLVGKKAEDAISLEVTLPDDHARAELRKKKATLDIAVHEVKRLVLPPLDEAFLSEIGFTSETEMRNWVREDIESRIGERIQEGLRGYACKYLLDKTEMQLPEGLNSRQADRVVMRRVLDLRKRGVPDAAITKHIDELRTGARDEAAGELKLNFIMEKIAEERDIHVGEEEVNARIAQIAARYNRRFDRVRDDLSRGDGLSTLYIQIRDEKIIDGLVADAEITEEEAKKAPAKPKAAKKTTAKKSTPKAAKKTARKKNSAGKSD